MVKNQPFEFATAGRIRFGEGTLAEAGRTAAGMGSRALVVSSSQERADSLLEVLSAAGVTASLYFVKAEPTVEVVQQATEQARRESCDLVAAIGGGSALDAGKAVSALLTNPGDLYDYLEVVGRGKTIPNPAAPMMAIPTTAGTGSEVTRNSVMSVPEQRFKVSMRSPLMLPRLALVDPELTYSLPPEVTASTGLDALTQLIEPYVSSRANPLTDGLCLEGMRRAARSLRRAYEDGQDHQARRDMALASLFGGLALANSGLGAVHGFASPLGGMFPAPHGAVCARLLPLVMEANQRALARRKPEHPALHRYEEIARILTGRPDARPEDGTAWVGSLVEDLNIPSLSTYGIQIDDLPELVDKSSQASSMKANPIELESEELYSILAEAL